MEAPAALTFKGSFGMAYYDAINFEAGIPSAENVHEPFPIFAVTFVAHFVDFSAAVSFGLFPAEDEVLEPNEDGVSIMMAKAENAITKITITMERFNVFEY